MKISVIGVVVAFPPHRFALSVKVFVPFANVTSKEKSFVVTICVPPGPVSVTDTASSNVPAMRVAAAAAVLPLAGETVNSRGATVSSVT